ncbi:MAG: carboxypeptidase-like regulatory domain-containing protein [Chitinophagaceae bacterium]
MKQKLQLHIPEPCHENWDTMTGTEQGRFCMSCQKEVVDFSVMTDKEILHYISKASSNICGRVQDDQLGRSIHVPHERKQYPFKYFWSVLITSFLISNESSGQVMSPKDTMISLPAGLQINNEPIVFMGGMSTVRKTNVPKWQISGRVVDENNNAVPYASVIVKRTKQGTMTDSAGLFSLETKSKLDRIELLISSVGFIQQTITLNNAATIKSLEIEDGAVKAGIADVLLISLKTNMMGEVVITAPAITTKRMGMGAMISCVKYTTLEKVKNKLLGTDIIKIYPNPVSPHSVFNIIFNIKEGEYALQFTDVSGKIIGGKQLYISAKNQLERFNGNIFSGSGMYFVSVICKQNTKMYTAKLLVQ